MDPAGNHLEQTGRRRRSWTEAGEAWYRKNVASVTHDLVRGVQLAPQSVAAVLAQTRTRDAWLRTVGWVAGVVGILYVVGHVVLIPARMVLWVVATATGQPDLDDTAFARLDGFLQTVVFVWIPLLIVTVMRYLWTKPLDDLFLVALAEHAPELGGTVAGRRPATLWTELARSLARTARAMAIAAAVAVAATLPVIGAVVYAASQLYVTVRALGTTLAVALALLPFVPGVPVSSLGLLSTALACRAVARELLEPYLSRMCPDDLARRRFFAAHGTLLIGFSAPFVLAMALPLAGPLVFVLAQAAIAVPLAECWMETPPNRPSPG